MKKALKSVAMLGMLTFLNSCSVAEHFATRKTAAERTAAETALLAGCANGGGVSSSRYQNTDGKIVEIAANSNFSSEQCAALWKRYYDVQERKAEQPILIQQNPTPYQGSYYTPGTYLGSICVTGCTHETKTTTTTVAKRSPDGNSSSTSTTTRTRTR